MPLLHQEDIRGGGGSSENRRTYPDFLSEPAAAPVNRRNDGSDKWRYWGVPGSPEVAQTPQALLPSKCYPLQRQSYSESARLGSECADDISGQSMADLLASLALSTSNNHQVNNRHSTSIEVRLSCDGHEKSQVEPPWPPEQSATPQANDGRILTRRASFCGVVSSGRNGEALTWSGNLPARCEDPSAGFSAKVFMGGLPYDITEAALMQTLRHFQPVRVEWPGRESGEVSPRGFAYVTFDSERRVRALLAASRRNGTKWYYKVATRKMRSKEVEVIPWSVCDSSWVCGGSARLQPARTVFVGALHGMLSAQALAHIMNDLFGGVVYAGIDTDKNKYPIGSGRVTFNNVRSYVRAISAAYVEIHTDKFTKKVQVDPYLEDSMCSVCNLQQGPYFCREPTCFRYFCRSCWVWQHSSEQHKPLMRNCKSSHLSLSPSPPNANLYNGGFNGPNEGTPSPSTSGTSATSEIDHAGEESSDVAWPLH